MAVMDTKTQATRERDLADFLWHNSTTQAPDVEEMATNMWQMTAGFQKTLGELAVLPDRLEPAMTDAVFGAFDDGLHLGLALAQGWPTRPQGFGIAWLLQALEAAGLELREREEPHRG